MSRLTVAQPSAMAAVASSHWEHMRGRRFPVALSSDKDSEGGAPLTSPTASGTDADSVITAVNSNANVPTTNPVSPPPRVPSKLNANTAEFIPSGARIDAVPDSTPPQQLDVRAQYQRDNMTNMSRPLRKTPPTVETHGAPAAALGSLLRWSAQENDKPQPSQPQNHQASVPVTGGGVSSRRSTQASPENVHILKQYLYQTTRGQESSATPTRQQKFSNHLTPSPYQAGENGKHPTNAGLNATGSRGLPRNLSSYDNDASQASQQTQLNSSSHGLPSLPSYPSIQDNVHEDRLRTNVQSAAGQAQRLTGSTSNGSFYGGRATAAQGNGLTGSTSNGNFYGSGATAAQASNGNQPSGYGASRGNRVSPRLYEKREQARNLYNIDENGRNENQTMAQTVPVVQGYRGGLTGSWSEGSLLGPRNGGRNYGAEEPDREALVQYKQQPPHGYPVQFNREATNFFGPLYFRPVPEEIQQQRSPMLNMLTRNAGVPSIQELLHSQNFPFCETYRSAKTSNHGVVHLTNIPYNITRSEIIAFFGRNSKILNDSDEPIHIIMDRVNSKTMDCYVEFMTLQDASNAVKKHQDNIQNGRSSRIGSRNIELELSSQGQLKKDLFPVAKGVDWNANPMHTITTNSPFTWENFKGFISEEETTMMFKVVDTPNRAQYLSDCPERVYESLISTLKKMPWHMPQYITIKERHTIYDATVKMIDRLAAAVQRDDNNMRLTPQLLNRLVTAAMTCPGFSIGQRDSIAYVAKLDANKIIDFKQPPFADLWRHQYALAPKPDMPLDVVEFYIALICEETTRVVDQMNIGRRHHLQGLQSHTSSHWGYFWRELNYPSGPEFDNMTLAQAADREFDAIERVLIRAIEGGPPPSY